MNLRNNITKHLSQSLSITGIVLITVFCFRCRDIDAPGPPRSDLDSVLNIPISTLNIPVYYPIRDLQNLLNEKFSNKIIEAPIAINQKGDSLFLSISKFSDVILKYDGKQSLTYQLPLLVTGTVHSKILGFELKNKTPVKTKLLLTLRSALKINEQWQMKTNTSIVDFKWVQEPVLKIGALKFNLSSSIEKAIFKNEDKLTSHLDNSIATLINVEKTIGRVWTNLQKPILINKKVRPVWLKAEPIGLSEQIIGHSIDTLMVQINLRTKLQTILDTANLSKSFIPLPNQDSTKSIITGLEAYLLVTIPFSEINIILKQVTDTMNFQFEGHSVSIKRSEVYGTPNGLAVRLNLSGDLKARLYLTGKPGYDTLSQNLLLQEFGFDVNSQESLINAADWFSHDDIVNRVQPNLSLSVGHSIDTLPHLIFQGIEKGKLGEKIELNFSSFNAGIHQYLITKDNIQVIIVTTGNADIKLQRGIFNKKKK